MNLLNSVKLLGGGVLCVCLLAAPAEARPSCVGDCNADRKCDVAELLTIVNVALVPLRRRWRSQMSTATAVWI